jgi:excisionase family DNA binding protein
MTYRLYRHYNTDGELLYVGISLNAFARLVGHRDHSTWFADISRVELEAFETKEAALEAEKIAIQKERPTFNVQHNPVASLKSGEVTPIGQHRLLVSIKYACAHYGCSPSHLYELLAAGKIRAIRDGRRTKIEVASGDAYFLSRAAAEFGGKRLGGDSKRKRKPKAAAVSQAETAR